MKKTILTLGVLFGLYVGAFAQDLPVNAEPGKCYVKCVTKDEFKDVEVTFMVKPGYSVLEAVPAVYKQVEEKVLIKEASKKLTYIPAVYETVEVSYTKKAAGSEVSIVPATFGTGSKRIEIFPKTSGWEYKVLEDCPSVNKEDCMTACFIEYPARYNNFSLTTLTKDAHAESTSIPAVPTTYTKQVIKTPARMETVVIPAEYATITKTVLVSPASTTKVDIPAEYQTVTKQVLSKEGGMTVWEEVDCQYLVPNLLPIFYELNSARLTKESEQVIDDLLLPLLEGNNTEVKIMSHTDSRGSDSYNLALSKQRAEAVVDYLASQGISRSRMSSEGYGETRLVNDCANGVDCTDAQHQANRRTEFKIIGGI